MSLGLNKQVNYKPIFTFSLVGLWDFVAWFISNIANLLLLFLIIATVVTPVIIYLLERGRIPKLKFDGFFKTESSEAGATGVVNATKYFVKIINTNRRTEGNTGICQGFITLGNKKYTTVWEYDYAGNSFAKEALLQVFYKDKDQNTINFINYQQSQQIKDPIPYNGIIHESITIWIECERGQCPKPITKSIENIIKNATCF
jgi:hypothetical protein